MVGFSWAGSSCIVNAPKEAMDLKSYRISRIEKDNNYFCYQGKVDGKPCKFKIDTGSDVSIINERLLKEPKQRILINKSFLKYPTRESSYKI